MSIYHITRTLPLTDERVDAMTDAGTLVPSVILVIREENGEIRLNSVPSYRDVEDATTRIEAFGGEVLMVVEGETDLGAEESSAWIRY